MINPARNSSLSLRGFVLRPASWATLAACLALQGCASHGSSFSELALADGWQPLPVGRWLLNDGITPKAIVICPADLCGQMSVVALFEAEGAASQALERSLASDALLSQRKARPRARTIGGKLAKTPGITATTRIERFMVDGMAATRVALLPAQASGPAKPRGNAAHAVVLTTRQGGVLKAVVAVATAPDMALEQARAAAKDW